MVAPRSTYRLQLGPDQQFADVAALAPYLGRLGVTHAYLSPVLQAAPGSTHGYDAVDQTLVSRDLGGEAALRAAARALAEEGIGIVVDVVPNHVAIPVPEHLNRQFWSLLKDGRASAMASWFDIHWSEQGRVLLPVLGQPLAACLGDGELTLDRTGGPHDEPVLRYFDHVFPVRPGTEGLGLAELVDAQHYELAVWRRGNDEVNYRRFFDVDALVGIRVEVPEVFDATHATLLRLRNDGIVEGFRIDHVDGLADPAAYLRRLAERAGDDTWTVVEKILLDDEQLPAGWSCAGTTGYDALGRVDALFVDPAGVETLQKGFAAVTGEPRDWLEVEREARRHVLSALLGAEVGRLVQLALDICAEEPLAAASEPTQLGLADAVVELLVRFPVYRLYVDGDEPAGADVTATWDALLADATTAVPHRATELRLVHDLALRRFGDSPLKDEFVRRFQQTSGPVVAKGVEDTATYRWMPVSSLNEVGSRPDRTGETGAAFHAWAADRARRWPATMNALSTHDTKRSEDVRARISALTEASGRWLDLVAEWTSTLLPAGSLASDRLGHDPTAAWLLWQTLWGAWPLGAERLSVYLTKAAREAKLQTSWLAPDADYESALLDLGARALADPAVAAAVATLEQALRPSLVANTLGARAVQLLLPGVADVYQGSERVFLRLADPDNRTNPDWSSLPGWLDEALEHVPDPLVDLDQAKLRLTAVALRLRRDRPALFGPDDAYGPLDADGSAREHFFGFRRGDVAVTATRWATGLHERGGWASSAVALPPGRWLDLLTETPHDVGPGGLDLATLHARWPVALLVREH